VWSTSSEPLSGYRPGAGIGAVIEGQAALSDSREVQCRQCRVFECGVDVRTATVVKTVVKVDVRWLQPILRGGGDDGNQNGTVVAMTKTERWYAIVEELRASAPPLCSYGFQRLRLRPSASC
jgi:hypothetical protein